MLCSLNGLQQHLRASDIFAAGQKSFFFFMNEAGLVAAGKLKKKPDATEF